MLQPSPGPEDSTTDEAPPASAPPSSTLEERPIEERLFAAMDKAMLGLIESLTDEDAEGNISITDAKSMATIRLVMDWMAKSKRIRPEEASDLPKGVEAMRKYIADAINEGKPKPKRGRPPKPKGEPEVEEGLELARALGVRE